MANVQFMLVASRLRNFLTSGAAPHTNWTEVWRGSAESLDVDMMVEQSCRMMAVVVVKSTNKYKTAGMECFTRVKFGNVKVIGYDSIVLMYTSLHEDMDLDSRYWEGFISVIMKEIVTYAVHISDDVNDRDGRSYHIWTVPA